jgi:hypothetical protein
MQFLKNFTNTISYRYAERIAGDSYSVVDLGASYTLHAFELSLFANNIFNTEYTETNLVPMPKVICYLECNITLDRQSQSKPKFMIIEDFFYFRYMKCFQNQPPELNQQEQNDALQKTLPNDLIDFASNDYLGFLSQKLF